MKLVIAFLILLSSSSAFAAKVTCTLDTGKNEFYRLSPNDFSCFAKVDPRGMVTAALRSALTPMVSVGHGIKSAVATLASNKSATPVVITCNCSAE